LARPADRPSPAIRVLPLKQEKDAPMRDMQDQLADLPPERRKLLAHLVRQAAARPHPAASAPPRRAPLSFAQQRLWVLERLQPGSTRYTMPVALRLRGALDRPALARSLAAIVARHETLRTTFAEVDGAPVQLIAPTLAIPLEQRAAADPASGLTPAAAAAARAAWAQQQLDQLAQVPFDLLRGPLLRVHLLTLTPTEQYVLLLMHHLICDGWSRGVIVHELVTLYAAYAGQPPAATIASPLPPLPLQYADYAVQQRAWLQGPVRDQQLDYWRRQLADLPRLALPTDLPRPATPSDAGAQQTHTLAPALTAALHALSLREGATLFMTLLTAFQILLQRLTGQDDLVVGSGIANRTRAALEPLIGFFVNTLVLRTDLGGDPSVRAALQRVRQVCLEAYAHQELPFEQLVEALQPARDLTAAPLFQVSCVLHNTPLPRLALPGLAVEQLELPRVTAKFDLSLFAIETAAGLELRLEYSTALFTPATITRMLAQLDTLLQGMAATPEARISQLPLLPAAERDLLLAWRRTAPAAPPDALLPALIAAQAARTPAAVAAVYGAETLSYAALMQRATALAQVLQAHGVGPEVRVGVCLERSLTLVVAVLGVWLAGGALVPLAPDYPPARRQHMLTAAAVAVLVTDTARRQDLAPPPAAAPRVLCLDDLGDQRADPVAPLAVDLHPDHLAYIIFTSGSTGAPKGVAVPHRGLPALAAAQRAAFGVGPHSRVLQWAALSFDAAIAEIIVALTAGAALVLAPAAALAPGPALTDLLRAQAITTVTLPPSALAELPPPAAPAALPALTTLVVAGEACPAALAARWAGPWRFVNAYGPTEATVCATLAHASASGGAPPIGQPLPGVTVYVLDAAMALVPVGAAGELYLGGSGLARGYLAQPALTAARFVPDPFSVDGGARLYRTGDRVRWQPTGHLAYLGRTDAQLKLRGVRIEPGEIEAALRTHPAVRDAAVLLAPRAGGRSQLAAFVTPQLTDADADAAAPTSREAAQVAQWQTLYDDLHRQARPTPDVGDFNPLGWVSSATREPIPAAELRAGVAATVARIQAGRPRRVLELGCGLGLLLFPLAPHCEHYTATDVSAAALAYVRAQLAARPALAARVTLAQRAADDLSDLPPGPYDTIVLNSVVQYFPSLAYLRRVLTQAAARLGAGGRIVIGDVRSWPLLHAFHAAVALEQADAAEPRAALALRAQQATAYEPELALDPAVFPALRQDLPQLRAVQVLLKRGRAANELTAFRYDVLLDLGAADRDAPPPAAQLAWTPGLTAAALRTHLAAAAPARLVLTGAPNARLTTALRTAALLADPAGPATAGALRSALAAGPADAALEPEEVWALGAALGYTVHLTWTAGAPGAFDAVFARDAAEAAALLAARAGDPAPGWAAAASAPLRALAARALGDELRRFLTALVPAALVPATYTVLPQLPRTLVGKRDDATLRAFRTRTAGEGAAAGAAEAAPRTATERTLAGIWATALGVGAVGRHDNFFALGGDSLLALRVAARASEAGLPLTPRQLFEQQTVATLAAALGAAPTISAEQGIVTGDVPFTQYWFFEKDFPEPHHWNVSTLLEVRQRLDPARVRAVVQRLLEQHDALRLRYARDGDGWRSFIAAPDDEIPFVSIDLAALPADAQRAAIETHAAQLQRSLDLTHGPLLRVALFDLGPEQSCRLLVIAHHLAADGASLQILLEDIQTAYQQLDQGLPIQLPPKTTSFKDWAGRLLAHAQTPELKAELGYWLARPWHAVAPLPVDSACPRSANIDSSMEIVTVTLDQAATERLLQETLTREDAQINEALLAALALALAPWTGRPALLTEIVVHGRLILDSVDLSRTVGWLAAGTVAILDPGSATTPSAALQTIKADLRQIPDSYGILRYLCKDAEIARQIRALPTPDIMFNYLGQFDQIVSDASPFRPASESRGRTHNEQGMRERLLEVMAGIFQGRLQVTWRYSRAFHHQATIERLAEAHLAALRALIEGDQPPAW
jgi:amino acid adenylation domain-containing protein/non-ribosomal peptide synthase protein (TIGR01720 family)